VSFRLDIVEEDDDDDDNGADEIVCACEKEGRRANGVLCAV
jgi:hypothetical protein